MTLMFLLVRLHLQNRQIRLDFHQDGPQLLHLLVGERESKSTTGWETTATVQIA